MAGKRESLALAAYDDEDRISTNNTAPFDNTRERENGGQFKFRTLAQRLAALKVDVVHRVRHSEGHEEQQQPGTDVAFQQCFLSVELDRLRDVDSSTPFKKLYYRLWPMVQTLPQLLHHLDAVVSLLEREVRTQDSLAIPSVLSLISVLARDLAHEFYPFFHRTFKLLADQIDTSRAEFTAKIFETMAYIVKYMSNSLVRDSSSLGTWYGPLLGHRKNFVRTFAAETFAVIVRKLKGKHLRGHLQLLLKALAQACIDKGTTENDGTSESHLRKRKDDVINGVCLLLFYTCKGVRGSLHSNCGASVAVVLDTLSPILPCLEEALQAVGLEPELLQIHSSQPHAPEDLTLPVLACYSFTTLPDELKLHCTQIVGERTSTRLHASIYGQLTRELIDRLTFHIDPSNASDLLARICAHSQTAYTSLCILNRIIDPPLEWKHAVVQSAVEWLKCINVCVCTRQGRLLKDEQVASAFVSPLAKCACVFVSQVHGTHTRTCKEYVEAAVDLFCAVWLRFRSSSLFGQYVGVCVQRILDLDADTMLMLVDRLFGKLPRNTVREHLLHPMLEKAFSDGGGVVKKSATTLEVPFQVLSTSVDVRLGVEDIVNITLSLTQTHRPKATQALPKVFSSKSEVIAELHAVALLDAARLGLEFGLGLELPEQTTKRIVSLKVIEWVASSPVFPILPSRTLILTVAGLVKHTNTLLAIMETSINTAELSWSVLTTLRIIENLSSSCNAVSNPNSTHKPQPYPNTNDVLTDALIEATDSSDISSYIHGLYTSLKAMILNDPSPKFSIGLLCAICTAGVSLKRREVCSGYDSGEFVSCKGEAVCAYVGLCVSSSSYWLRSLSLIWLALHDPIPYLDACDSSNANPSLDDIYNRPSECVHLCLEIVRTPVGMSTLRALGLNFSKLEVLIRSGRLPHAYSILIASLSLGFLHVKLMDAWKMGTKTYLTCARATYPTPTPTHVSTLEAVHNVLIRKLKFVNDILPMPTCAQHTNSMHTFSDIVKRINEVDDGEHCVTGDITDHPLFYLSHSDVQGEVMVQSDARTDMNTLYELVYDVLRQCPEITLRRSKSVVPSFLSFLHFQYFARFDDDPDRHQLQLAMFVDTTTTDAMGPYPPTDVTMFSPKLLRARLISFLKVFAEIPSPLQIHLHKLLYKVYVCMFAKPDAEVARIALDCVITYNNSYITPYKENLKRLLDDSKLREELVMFSLAEDQRIINAEHRAELIPMIIRILFGRFVSKPSKSKNTRDMSVGRRAAILSFMAALPSSELKEFVFLMIRGFAVVVKGAEKDSTSGTDSKSLASKAGEPGMTAYEALRLVHFLTYTHINEISDSRKVGFLTLLADVIRLLGHRVIEYLQYYTHIVVVMLQHCEAEDLTADNDQLQTIEGHQEWDDNDNNDEDTLRTDSTPNLLNISGPDPVPDMGLSAAQDVEDLPSDWAAVKSSEDEQTLEANARVSNDKVYGSRRLGPKIRGMCVRRLTETVRQYHTVYDLAPHFTTIWPTLHRYIESLPATAASCSSPPAILLLIETLAQHADTVDIIKSYPVSITSIIGCIGSAHGGRVCVSVLKVVFNIVQQLLDHDGGVYLSEYTTLLVENFTRRLGGLRPSSEETRIVGEEIDIDVQDVRTSPEESIGAMVSRVESFRFLIDEFHILCRVCENIHTYKKQPDVQTIQLLATLMLPFMRTSFRQTDEAKLDIFGIYTSLVSHLEGFRVSQHIAYLAKLLGPNTRPYSQVVHEALTGAFVSVCNRPGLKEKLERVGTVVENLNAYDKLSLDRGRDFEKCMPYFHELSNDDVNFGWASLVQRPEDVQLATAVVYVCVFSLHDEELGVRLAAVASLRTLIRWVGQASQEPQGQDSGLSKSQQWLLVVENILMPMVRRGLRFDIDSVRKGYVSVLAETVASLGHLSSPMFHGDLRPLLREDEEADFFQNISHVQLHRRARACVRVSKMLENDTSEQDVEASDIGFSEQTLTHVLLPLGWMPVASQEFIKKDHTSFLRDCVGLMKSVCQCIQWSNYHRTLRAVLRKLSSVSPEREAIFVAALVAVIEAFHFKLENVAEDNLGDNEDTKADEDIALIPPQHRLTHTITRTIIPWVQKFITKTVKNRNGMKSKVVRPSVCMAVLHLIRHLPPASFDAHLHPVIITIVNCLQSKDVGTREVARETLAKAAVFLGCEYLYKILYEMKHQLNTGYKLHVRSYTLFTVLLSLSSKYAPPVLEQADMQGLATMDPQDVVRPEFDKCVEMINEFVMDELFGEAAADREAEGAIRTIIREAKGTKAYDTIETTSKMILFRPTYGMLSPEDPAAVSSIHALVGPYLAKLRDCTDTKLMGKLSEVLHRVCLGLANNSSVTTTELLLFVYATVSPFVSELMAWHRERSLRLGRLHGEPSESVMTYDEYESGEEELVVGEKRQRPASVHPSENVSLNKAPSWVVGAYTHANSGPKAARRTAVEMRMQERERLLKVEDGANAPKLSGFNRHGSTASADPKKAQGKEAKSASFAAVKFGLELLHGHLKRHKLDRDDPRVREMVDPFIPVLTRLLTVSTSLDVTSLCLKVLCQLLPWGLPSMAKHASSIGDSAIRVMMGGGAAVDLNTPLVQSCLRALASLLTYARVSKKGSDDRNPDHGHDPNPNPTGRIPISMDRARALLSLLTSNVLEVDHQSATFGLIRTMVGCRLLCAEMYTLVDALMKVTVTSHLKGVREAAAQVVVQFLLEYPLSEKRLVIHLRQAINNLAFDHEDGRASGVSLCMWICEALPLPVLDQNATMFLLPLSLRLVNDTSPRCRQLVSECLRSILRKVSPDTFVTYFTFTLKWFGLDPNSDPRSKPSIDAAAADLWIRSEEKRSLNRIACQVCGIMAEARPDLLKKGGRCTLMMESISSTVATVLRMNATAKKSIDVEDVRVAVAMTEDAMDAYVEEDTHALMHESLWVSLYFCLTSFTKIYQVISLDLILSRMSLSASGQALAEALYTSPDAHTHTHFMDAVSDCLMYPHLWVRISAARAMNAYLLKRNCLSLKSSEAKIEFLLEPNALYDLGRRLCGQLEACDRIDCTHSVTTLLSLCVSICVWVVRATQKHVHVQKSDDGLEQEGVNKNAANWIMHRLSSIAIRAKSLHVKRGVFAVFASLTDACDVTFVTDNLRHMLAPLLRAGMDATSDSDDSLTAAATELRENIERKVGSAAFIDAYSVVQTQASEKKRDRKRALSSTAITDPRTFAQRKIARTETKKDARKRKVDRFRAQRGAAPLHKRQRLRRTHDT